MPRAAYPPRKELPVAIGVGSDTETKRRMSVLAGNRNLIFQSSNYTFHKNYVYVMQILDLQYLQ